MKLITKLASKWAENNSSPGATGRDELFEILIEVQKQGYEAGFRKAREMAYQLMAKGDPKCFGLDVDIENLGEEEV